MVRSAEHHLHEFLAHLAVERNLSPRTIESYRRDLMQFSVWLDEQTINLSEVERATLRNYLGSRRDQGLSARSAARALSALRGFFRFLVNTQIRDSLRYRTPGLRVGRPEDRTRAARPRLCKSDRQGAQGTSGSAR